MSLGKQNLKATFPKEKTEIQVSFSTPALEGHKIPFHRDEARETSTKALIVFQTVMLDILRSIFTKGT